MGHFGWIIILLSFTLYSECTGETTRPNIIFIMADDLGWNDVGFHNPKVKTPNIDWLAQEGIELTDSYSQIKCTPSRSALMTGKYPSNNGMSQGVAKILTKNCLPLEHKILPQYLKDAGYATKYVGKWHLGDCDKRCLPTNRGFDEYRGILAGEATYYSWENGGLMVRFVNDTPSSENLGRHMTTQDKMDVKEMIRSHTDSEKPLFMMISPTAPHTPLQVTQEMFDVHADVLPDNATDSVDRRKCLGLVSALDDLVGETIQALKDSGMYNNSVIIFTSDNGGQSLRILRQPNTPPAAGNNYPLRGGKGMLYNGGVRVPTVYLDTRLGNHTSGTTRDFLMHITDWLPTLTQFAGLESIKHLDGVAQNLNLGAEYNASEPNQKYRVREDMLISNTNFSPNDALLQCGNGDAAFRYKNWKLIYGTKTGLVEPSASEWVKPVESPELENITGDSCYRVDKDGNRVVKCLFDLEADPSEQRNLYDSHPDVVNRLLLRIRSYEAVQMKNTYKPSPFNITGRVSQLGNYTVPIQGYCDPATDFPLAQGCPNVSLRDTVSLCMDFGVPSSLLKFYMQTCVFVAEQ